MNKKTIRFKKPDGVDVAAWIFTFLALVIVLCPFLYVVSLSLSSSDAILQGRVGLYPIGFNLDSYKEILKTPKILNAYKNSILYTGSSVLLSLVLTAITAYPLSRKFLPGRTTMISMIVFTMFFSGGMIPFYILMQNLGLINNIWAIILPWAIPQFELFLLKNYFENTPNEIYEAATVDGANDLYIFAKIYVPLATPIFATIAIFFATHQWNSYMVPLMYLSSPSKFPLQIVLQEMLVQDEAVGSTYVPGAAMLTSQGLKNATVVMSVLPLLILYPFVQRFFIGSIYVGSVKG